MIDVSAQVTYRRFCLCHSIRRSGRRSRSIVLPFRRKRRTAAPLNPQHANTAYRVWLDRTPSVPDGTLAQSSIENSSDKGMTGLRTAIPYAIHSGTGLAVSRLNMNGSGLDGAMGHAWSGMMTCCGRTDSSELLLVPSERFPSENRP